MRELVAFAFTATTVGIAVAFAQQDIPPPSHQPVYPSGGGTYVGTGGWGTYHHASTAAEGRLRGMGDLVRSKGQANLDNSAAAINYSVARQNQIENRSAWTNTYFEMRRANKAYRAAERGPKPTMEQLVRYAQAGKPKRLSPGQLDTVTGEMNWPILLRSEKFNAHRSELESIFARRAASSVIGTDGYLEVARATEAMLADLTKNIRQLPPAEYMAAKRFLQSLAYEAGLPAS